eukprot:4361672-Amphidinium_carterae.1
MPALGLASRFGAQDFITSTRRGWSPVDNTNTVKVTQQISKETEMTTSNMGDSMDLDIQILGTTSAQAAAVSDAAEPTAPPERFCKQQRNRTATLLSLLGKCR